MNLKFYVHDDDSIDPRYSVHAGDEEFTIPIFVLLPDNAVMWINPESPPGDEMVEPTDGFKEYVGKIVNSEMEENDLSHLPSHERAFIRELCKLIVNDAKQVPLPILGLGMEWYEE